MTEVAQLVGTVTSMGERIYLLEQEVLKLKGLPERRREERSRDLFIVKKNFATLPKYSGKAEDYDDWRFQASVFLSIETGFADLIHWIENQTQEPDQEDVGEWELGEKGRDADLMNDQLYNFLCLNTKDKALATVKNLATRKKINGVVAWWKFFNECRALTGQRIQALANVIYKPTRVKKYSDVMVAIEKWERDIRRFEDATGKIAEETKTFSLRQLVPEELDQSITTNSNTLKDYASVKAYVNEQVAIRRDRKPTGPCPMDVDRLADKIAEAQHEGADGGAWAGWTWSCQGSPQDDHSAGDSSYEGKGPGSNHEGEHWSPSFTLEELMSFVKGKGKFKGGKDAKGKGKQGKWDIQCWHCGKYGHRANECWQKDAEMEAYRAEKGKSKGKGSWFKGKGGDKGKGNKGAWSVDQGGETNPVAPTWTFSLRPAGGELDLPACERVSKGESVKPPGVSPKILSPTMWDVFREEDEATPEVLCRMETDDTIPRKHKRGKMPRGRFVSDSQLKKWGKESQSDDEYMDGLITENSITQLSAKGTDPQEDALCYVQEPNRSEGMNMLKGWCREEEGWTRVRSVMDSGAGVSVAPPGMCPAYPIEESAGSRRGQEFISASEDTIPNLGEQKLDVVLDSNRETAIKYQIADVSRALNSVAEICDSGHRDYGHQVVFGRKGGTIINLETGAATHFARESNVYCLDYWVKPFTGQGR